MRRALALFALASIGFSGCFGSCNGGGLREDTALVCADAAAPAGPYAIALGSDEDQKDFGSLEGAKLHLDYGAQGGMHFYYSVRLFGAAKGTLIHARFIPKGTSSATGSTSSGAGGATSSSSSSASSSSASSSSASSSSGSSSTGTGGGAGGSGGSAGGAGGGGGAGGAGGGPSGPAPCNFEGDAPDCYESEYVFPFDEYKVPTCSSGQWFELQNQIFQMTRRGPIDGTLIVEMGTCPTAGCQSDQNGDYQIDVQATAKAEISYVP